MGRYTFAGADPYIIIRANEHKIELTDGSSTKIVTGDIFSILAQMLEGFKGVAKKSVFPFEGGAVGYFGYELKNLLERLPRKNKIVPVIPDSIVGLYDTVFAFDHKTGVGYILSSGFPEKSPKARRLRARHRISQFLDTIGSAHTCQPPHYQQETPLEIKSNFTRKGYIAAIRHAQRYISSGDVYQINLSQRLTMPFGKDPLILYSNLRQINPSPFGAFLNYGNFQVLSNSPERFLMVQDGVAETSPIKGTRPRGETPAEDKRLMQQLRTSGKELAEHIMIVDLERNDLGKVSDYNSIKVRPLEKIYTYQTLHHMISTVRGRIKKGIGPVDCIRALFPGGSVTGAPKIRAMEIIEELEPMPRGIYTGAIGYIGFSGNTDMSMAIRTAVLKDSHLYLNVGGGIVADSIPEREYEETMLKASAFLKAIAKTYYWHPTADDLLESYNPSATDTISYG